MELDKNVYSKKIFEKQETYSILCSRKNISSEDVLTDSVHKISTLKKLTNMTAYLCSGLISKLRAIKYNYAENINGF